MSPIPDQPKAPFRALVTGSGPFSGVPINPAWPAVAPLHNAITKTTSSSIHVTAVGPLKVAYEPVLSVIPGLHARPPRLPSPGAENGAPPSPTLPPPHDSYDFVFHLGVGRPGNLSIEQVGHKSGYELPGVDDKLAPIISTDKTGAPHTPAMEQFETSQMGQPASKHNLKPHVKRGFAKGYERFPENLHTEIDVQGVIKHLRQQGETRVVSSTNAGYYLCDFMCYCGLAESQRPLFYPGTSDKNTRRSKSLFMHIPPQDDPFTIKEVTEVLRQIIAWVCTKEKALSQV